LLLAISVFALNFLRVDADICLENLNFKQEVLHMCAQELVALFRFSGNSCPACQRIVSRYERTLNLTDDDMEHLEQCILSKP
jgi:hypothetical protein